MFKFCSGSTDVVGKSRHVTKLPLGLGKQPADANITEDLLPGNQHVTVNLNYSSHCY